MPAPIRYFVPGPAWVDPDVAAAMTRPGVPHRSSEFTALYRSLAPRLGRLFRTSGDVVVATSSATLLLEAALVSTTAAATLHLTNGAFSERWVEIARAHGRRPDRLAVPWGEVTELALLRGALRRKPYEAVAVTHVETSTGVEQPLAEIARLVRQESEALLLVDAVSSLAACPVETDAWGLDVVVTASQKALALPPGLALAAISERAAGRAAAIPQRGYYTDLLRYRDRHRRGGTITTPAIPLVYALDRQLDRVLDEGVEARWRRHRALAERTRDWAAAAGFRYASAVGSHAASVSCLVPPAGRAAPALVTDLLAAGFRVGGGYGDWKETTFRIGHMGEIRSADLEELLAAIAAPTAR